MADEEQQQYEFAHFFTVSEANALLPQLSVWMTEMHQLHQQMADIIHSKSELARGNGRVIADIQQLRLDMETISASADRIRGLLDRINITGAIVKDLEQGLIDFPSQREGQVIFLCWMLGEDKVGFWHDLNTGAAGRKPL
jgi:hypothetical protein